MCPTFDPQKLKTDRQFLFGKAINFVLLKMESLNKQNIKLRNHWPI